VRNDVLEAHPGVAAAVFNAFAASKQQYMQKLTRGELGNPDALDRLHARIAEMGGDPLPYGIEPNRKVIEELIGHAMTQRILTKPVTVESLFAPATHSLTG
jgi:4,5-dihydroxyphthalate decarboxylase